MRIAIKLLIYDEGGPVLGQWVFLRADQIQLRLTPTADCSGGDSSASIDDNLLREEAEFVRLANELFGQSGFGPEGRPTSTENYLRRQAVWSSHA